MRFLLWMCKMCFLLLMICVSCESKEADELVGDDNIAVEEEKKDTSEEQSKNDSEKEEDDSDLMSKDPAENDLSKVISPFTNNPLIIPDTKKWARVEELSDEFEDGFDSDKWHRDPFKDPFRWIGRFPGLFESENVSVSGGDLRVTVKKFESPKLVKGKNWTHGGAILRSKAKAKHGQYYECRMHANKTIMSSTFWIAFLQNCNNGPERKLELDIQECVGRTHSETHSWAKKWDRSFHSNTWRHKRDCDVSKSQSAPAKTDMSEKNSSRYFVYGCWWKSPREILFYLDGKAVHKITNPPADFDIEGHITMAMETYDWNPIDKDNIFETASEEDRTTKYDWVRTWKLEDK